MLLREYDALMPKESWYVCTTIDCCITTTAIWRTCQQRITYKPSALYKAERRIGPLEDQIPVNL